MIISQNEIIIGVPDNWHFHFRQGKLLEFVTRILIESGWRGKVVAEPNTDPAILTGDLATGYLQEIKRAARQVSDGNMLIPVMTIQITEATTPRMIEEAYRAGVFVCKVYPRYVTTNSENGVVDYTKIYPALHAAADLGMVVQFHAEHPSFDVEGLDKESMFTLILDLILEEIPGLKISVEHVSSEEMVKWVKAQGKNVGASIAIHFLFETMDTLLGYRQNAGGKILVHQGGFKPCAKRRSDREAIRQAALSGNPKFWYGGDDALHPRSKKECPECACGAWNTLAALPLLISLFEENDKLLFLESFLSDFGSEFYGLSKNDGNIVFRREKWTVPLEMEIPDFSDSVVPYFAGQEMRWKLVG